MNISISILDTAVSENARLKDDDKVFEQVLALRVHAAACLFGVADNHNSFAKGSIGYKSEKCKEGLVLAARALLLPIVIQNSPRPARLVQSAMNSLIKLAGVLMYIYLSPTS